MTVYDDLVAYTPPLETTRESLVHSRVYKFIAMCQQDTFTEPEKHRFCTKGRHLLVTLGKDGVIYDTEGRTVNNLVEFAQVAINNALDPGFRRFKVIRNGRLSGSCELLVVI